MEKNTNTNERLFKAPLYGVKTCTSTKPDKKTGKLKDLWLCTIELEDESVIDVWSEKEIVSNNGMVAVRQHEFKNKTYYDIV